MIGYSWSSRDLDFTVIARRWFRLSLLVTLYFHCPTWTISYRSYDSCWLMMQIFFQPINCSISCINQFLARFQAKGVLFKGGVGGGMTSRICHTLFDWLKLCYDMVRWIQRVTFITKWTQMDNNSCNKIKINYIKDNITSPLRGKTTDDLWIPLTKGQ